MGPRTEGPSSSTDWGQIISDLTQERDALLAEAQVLHTNTVQFLKIEARLQAELAAARLQADERVQAAEAAVARLQAELAVAHATERRLLSKVTRLQADIIQRRGSCSSATASSRLSESALEARLRQIEERLMDRPQQLRHSRHSTNQASTALRAMRPPPVSAMVPPSEVPAPDDAQVEGVGTNVPVETQDAVE